MRPLGPHPGRPLNGYRPVVHRRPLRTGRGCPLTRKSSDQCMAQQSTLAEHPAELADASNRTPVGGKLTHPARCKPR